MRTGLAISARFSSLIILSLILMPAISPVAATSGDAVPVLQLGSFNQQPDGVRSFGMGAAQTGRADDLSAMYYNPAGFSLMGYYEFGVWHRTLAPGIQSNSFVTSIPVGYGTLGVGIQYAYLRDASATASDKPADPDTGKNTWQSSLSYGAPLLRRVLHGGITLRYGESNFKPGRTPGADYNAVEKSMFMDIGFLFRYNLSDLRGAFTYLPKVGIGLTAKNLKLTTEENYRTPGNPTQINAGLSFYYSYSAMFNVDFVNPLVGDPLIRTGLETWPFHFLAVRGGFGSAINGGPSRAIHWGVGLGNEFGNSKVSFEYAGQRRWVVTAPQDAEYYHQFAFHRSFEKIVSYKDPQGKERLIPVALADRYNNRFRFAREIRPRDIIESVESVLAKLQQKEDEKLKQLDPETPKKTEPDQPDRPQEPKPPVKTEPKVPQKGVAFFPMSVEYVAGRPSFSADDLAAEIRRDILTYSYTEKRLKPLSEIRYKLTPRREDREDTVTYMNRLCKFHSLDLIVFATMEVDTLNDRITVRTVYHKSGAKSHDAQSEVYRSVERSRELKADALREYRLQASGILDVTLENDPFAGAGQQ